MKTLDNTSVAMAQRQIVDLKVTGDGDAWQVICKASSKQEGWMKSTKAMEIHGLGCLVQVSTQQGDQVAEAITFVPNTIIVDDINDGRRLVRSTSEP